jgi:hypothetical protein
VREGVTQNNEGEAVRAALGDYVEIQSLSLSTDDLLTLLPREELDSLARKSERFFHQRFGFFARDEARAAFIAGKNEFRLTDRELSFLNWVGCARSKGNKVRFSATRLDAFVGSFFALLLLPFVATCMAALATIETWTPAAAAVILVALAVCGVLGWAIYQVCLRPRLVLGTFCRRTFSAE